MNTLTRSRVVGRSATAPKAILVVLATLAGLFVWAPSALAASTRVDLRVLVVDNGSPNAHAIAQQLDAEGVPHTTITPSDPGRPTVDAAFLADATTNEAYYQAVVLPDATGGGLGTDEMAALAAYEAQFKVRQVDGYDWANPSVGLNYAQSPGYIGELNGMTAQVTDAGKSSGFGYLRGPVPVTSSSYGYLATPLVGASFTPLVTMPIPGAGVDGSLVGVYNHDGMEQLVITAALSFNQQQFKMLAHGIVTWATQGIHFGYQRSYFTFHFDDAFGSDSRWSTSANCTPGEDCPVGSTVTTPDIRMSAADVTQVVAWEQMNNYEITLPFNGYYALYSENGDPWNGTDGLTNALVANKSAFRWLNHGYEHIFQGCQQDFTVIPWRCVTDPVGQAPAPDGSNLVWVPQSAIDSEITTNISVGQQLGLSFDPSEYLSGEHSGMYLLPQQPVDNPNFGAALTALGITAIGADASREPQQRQVGNALTVPRHPTAIYYNVSTESEEIDEYNWFYTTRADGGGGYCEDNPTVATCLPAPLGPNGFTNYIVPTDAAYDLHFILANDPRPFYGHVSNLTGPDYLGLTLMSAILDTYHTSYADNAPLVNLPLTQAADVLAKQQAWAGTGMGAGSQVSGYLQDGRVTIANPSSVAAPFTAPVGTLVNGSTFGQSYGGERSAWLAGDQILSPPAAVPAFTSADSATFIEQQAGSFTVAANGVPTPSLAVTGTLPPGLTFTDNGDGTATLAGTPSAESAGAYPLTFTASNVGGSVDQTFTLTVYQSPAITSAATTTFVVQQPGTFAVTATGWPTPTLQVNGTLPAGVTFTDNGDGTGTLAGTPAVGSAGGYPLSIVASNPGGSATQAFTLVAAEAPSITSDASATATGGSDFSFLVRTTGYPFPAIGVTGALPTGLTFTDNRDGTATLSGQPAAFAGGVYPLLFTATNPLGTAKQDFTLTVRQSVTFTSANKLQVPPRQTFTFTVTTSAYPAVDTITVDGALPAGVTFVDNHDGTATLSGSVQQRQKDKLTFNASNGWSTGKQSFQLTIK